jgi:hypothetical protein
MQEQKRVENDSEEWDFAFGVQMGATAANRRLPEKLRRRTLDRNR